ncbi:ParA family protein [Lactococcus lactis]|uniref:ParA family protein n=1 Tax=Lactococcus lactis TaxID=1358 RepID=UPI0018C73AE8|nr:AAA family ATPase [Lactococcus lactis]MBG1279292.1 AAA family ATPase [Lactococcus lactis subsp. lactis]
MKQGKITTLWIPKGGGIKTTTLQALVYGIKKLKPEVKMLAIGGDYQRNLTDTLCPGLPDFCMSLREILTDKVNINEAIIKLEVCDFIPESSLLSGLDLELQSFLHKEDRLKEALDELEEYYDYIFIDLAPATSSITINALTASDQVLITARASRYAETGVQFIPEVLKPVLKYTNPNLKIAGVVFGDVARTNLAKGLIQRITEYVESLGSKAYKTQIRHTVEVEEAQDCHMSIYDYSPDATASQDYLAFVKEFLEDE